MKMVYKQIGPVLTGLICFFNIVFILAARPIKPADSRERWMIERSSKLWLHGKSNVNQFTCEIAQYLHPDTLTFSRCFDNSSSAVSLNGGLRIPVKQFDCKHQFITQDLQQTLKAGKVPFIQIQLLQFGPRLQRNQQTWANCTVLIQIAGVTRKIDIPFEVKQLQSNYLEWKGYKQLTFQDFNLTPSKKLGGLIKVEQEIDVHFLIRLRKIETTHP